MSLLNSVDVSNVYIYVGDAVRWDLLPEAISKQGISVKSVAASIHTPTSFASVFSGSYLPQHGVTDFSPALSCDQTTLFDVVNGETVFSNSINQMFNTNPESESILDRTLGVEFQSHDALEDISSPFLMVERGRGGHAPYGDFDGNGWEYFTERGTVAPQRYRREYRNGIERDKEWFSDQLQTLESRDLLDDTLVIYTSDHGELLGENGVLGHNGPIHPQLAYVPTVFIHPELHDREITDGVFRHTDILPTVRGLLGDNPDTDTEIGRDISSQNLADWGACYYSKSYDLPIFETDLSYQSVWGRDGGHVFATSPQYTRLLIWLGKVAKSPKREFLREHITQNGAWYLKQHVPYDDPNMTATEAERYLEQISQIERWEGTRVDVDEEQLRNLGYMS